MKVKLTILIFIILVPVFLSLKRNSYAAGLNGCSNTCETMQTEDYCDGCWTGRTCDGWDTEWQGPGKDDPKCQGEGEHKNGCGGNVSKCKSESGGQWHQCCTQATRQVCKPISCAAGQSCQNNACVSNEPTVTIIPTNSTTVSPSLTAGISPTGNCSLKPKGDANCDGVVNAIDYSIWKEQYGVWTPAIPAVSNANFSCVEGNSITYIVDMIDFEIWRRNTSGGLK